MLVARLPLITAICLCALICGSIYWQLSPYIEDFLVEQGLIEANLQHQSQNSVRQATKPSRDTREYNYNISSFKLFGDTQAPVKKELVETEKLPETTLKLSLRGVLAGKNNLQAGALIEGPDRQTNSYRIDEEVPGGAILKQVYPDRVVLERSGRLENLVFEETRPIGIQTQSVAREAPPTFIPEPSHSAQSNLRDFNQQQTQQIKDRLSRLRSRLQSNGP
jgi:general secretion pathway protein C